jgi:hypothetical protein
MADIAASLATAARRPPARAYESTQRAKAFAAASRHSVLVRVLRVAILAGSIRSAGWRRPVFRSAASASMARR